MEPRQPPAGMPALVSTVTIPTLGVFAGEAGGGSRVWLVCMCRVPRLADNCVSVCSVALTVCCPRSTASNMPSAAHTTASVNARRALAGIVVWSRVCVLISGRGGDVAGCGCCGGVG